MKTENLLAYQPVPPELEALQFESLIESYIELGLTRAQASAATQADYLCSNRLAFRQRGTMAGCYLLVGEELAAA